MKNVVLVGFMGTGKTAVGERVARKLGLEFVDVDDLIEANEGMSIPHIFERRGEAYFRQVEEKMVREVSKRQGLVIGAGGGAVLFDENLDNLRKGGVIICLVATPETIMERTKGYSHRPLLNVEDPKGRIQELLKTRAPYYAKADHSIDTTNLKIDEVAAKVIELAKEDRHQ